MAFDMTISKQKGDFLRHVKAKNMLLNKGQVKIFMLNLNRLPPASQNTKMNLTFPRRQKITSILIHIFDAKYYLINLINQLAYFYP